MAFAGRRRTHAPRVALMAEKRFERPKNYTYLSLADCPPRDDRARWVEGRNQMVVTKLGQAGILKERRRVDTLKRETEHFLL